MRNSKEVGSRYFDETLLNSIPTPGSVIPRRAAQLYTPNKTYCFFWIICSCVTFLKKNKKKPTHLFQQYKEDEHNITTPSIKPGECLRRNSFHPDTESHKRAVDVLRVLFFKCPVNGLLASTRTLKHVLPSTLL